MTWATLVVRVVFADVITHHPLLKIANHAGTVVDFIVSSLHLCSSLLHTLYHITHSYACTDIGSDGEGAQEVRSDNAAFVSVRMTTDEIR